MRVVRFLGLCLLAIYLLLDQLFPTAWSELIVYNLIPTAAILAIACAPHISDKIAKPSVGLAVTFWVLGSAVASSAIFFSSSTLANTVSSVLYLLFYPFAIIGLLRLLAAQRKLSLIELVDSSIFGLGLSTLGSTLVLKPVLPHLSLIHI